LEHRQVRHDSYSLFGWPELLSWRRANLGRRSFAPPWPEPRRAKSQRRPPGQLVLPVDPPEDSVDNPRPRGERAVPRAQVTTSESSGDIVPRDRAKRFGVRRSMDLTNA